MPSVSSSAASQRAGGSSAGTCLPGHAVPSWHRPDDADDVVRHVPTQAPSDRAGNDVNINSALRMDGGLCSPRTAHIVQDPQTMLSTTTAPPDFQKVLLSQAHMGRGNGPRGCAYM